jgi:hypothetical protein
VVTIAVVLALGALAGVGADPGQPAGPFTARAASAQQAEAKVTLTSISPVATASGTVIARGHIVNTGDVKLTEVTAIFWVGQQRIDSQAELQRASEESPGERLGNLITWPVNTMDEMTRSLAPGKRSDFALRLTSEEIGFDQQGVYPVGVDIRATPVDQVRDTVGRAHTFMAYLPDPNAVGSVDVSFLAPLTAAPSAVDDTTLLDDSLAADIAPHGRLSRLLDLIDADESGALTPVLDPNLLTEAGIMAEPHHVLDQGTVTRDPAAANFVGRATRLFGADVSAGPLVLPFADPDVTALEHAHLANRLAGAAAASVAALTAAGVPPARVNSAPVTAWPADGLADAASLGALTDAGIHQVVLSRASLPYLPPPPSPSEPITSKGATSSTLGPDSAAAGSLALQPAFAGEASKSGKAGKTDKAGKTSRTGTAGNANKHRSRPKHRPTLKPLGTPQVRISTGSGVLSTIVVEPTLLAGGPAGANRSLLVRQRFLAETALVAMGIPKRATYRLVAALPRDFTGGAAIDSILNPPVRATWLHARPLAEALGTNAPPYTATATEPKAARANELSGSVIAALKRYLRASGWLATITKTTPPPSGKPATPEQAAAQSAVDRGYLRSSSIAWRTDPDGGIELAHALTRAVRRQLTQVRLSAPKVVTLSGASGSFPVTVTNELSLPVTVRVRLTSLDPTVVGSLTPQESTVDAQRRNSLKFTASSDHSGVATVEAQLFTPDGHALGAPTRFTVRATQYGIVGWVILGAGVVLLLAAAAIRNIRDYRRRRASAS